MKRFRGGLVFKAQIFVLLNSRLESNKEEEEGGGPLAVEVVFCLRLDDHGHILDPNPKVALHRES